MRKLRKLICEKKGTTMAEMLVTLLLIMIMTGGIFAGSSFPHLYPRTENAICAVDTGYSYDRAAHDH